MEVLLVSFTTSWVNLVELLIIFVPVPVPEIVRSVPSVLISTLLVSPPNFILLSDVGNFISPYTVKLCASVVGLKEPIVTFPSGISILRVTVKLPTACVSIWVEPVKNVKSVNATCPPVYTSPAPNVTLKAQSVYIAAPLVTYCVAFASGLAFEKSGALKVVTVPVCATPPIVPDHVAALAAKSARS